ncbi:MAG: signal peptidase II [Solirubrobacterales bacterium]
MSLRGSELGKAGAVALVAIALDQVSKAIVRGRVLPGEQIDLIAGVQIVRVHNSGIAFGMLDDAGSIVIVIAAIAFAALLSMFLLSAERRGLWLPVGLLAGGALGNLIDRAREGYVTDFIDPPRWPAFNIADIEITVGVILLVTIYVLQPDPDPEPEASGDG